MHWEYSTNLYFVQLLYPMGLQTQSVDVYSKEACCPYCEKTINNNRSLSIQIDAATTNLMIFTVEYFKLSRSITKLEMLFYGCL